MNRTSLLYLCNYPTIHEHIDYLKTYTRIRLHRICKLSDRNGKYWVTCRYKKIASNYIIDMCINNYVNVEEYVLKIDEVMTDLSKLNEKDLYLLLTSERMFGIV